MLAEADAALLAGIERERQETEAMALAWALSEAAEPVTPAVDVEETAAFLATALATTCDQLAGATRPGRSIMSGSTSAPD